MGGLHREVLAIREYIAGYRKKGELKIIKELQEISPGGWHMPFPGATAPQIVIERLKAAKSYLETVENHIEVLQLIHNQEIKNGAYQV